MKKYIKSEILIVNLKSQDILTTSLTTNTNAINDVEGGAAGRRNVFDEWYEGY